MISLSKPGYSYSFYRGKPTKGIHSLMNGFTAYYNTLFTYQSLYQSGNLYIPPATIHSRSSRTGHVWHGFKASPILCPGLDGETTSITDISPWHLKGIFVVIFVHLSLTHTRALPPKMKRIVAGWLQVVTKAALDQHHHHHVRCDFVHARQQATMEMVKAIRHKQTSTHVSSSLSSSGGLLMEDAGP